MRRTSSELKRIARENLRGHYALPIGTTIVAGLITSAVLTPFNLIYQFNRTDSNLIIYYIAALFINLVSIILSCGVLRIHLKLARREAPAFSDLFYYFTRRPDRFLLEGLLLIAISLACMLPGAVCLIAGIYMKSVPLTALGVLLFLAGTVAAVILSLALNFVFLLLMDHDSMSVMEAFHTSLRLMAGNKGRLFYIQLSFLGWALLAVLSCGLGMLWLSPYMNQTTVEFYRDITGELDRKNSAYEDAQYDKDAQYYEDRTF